MHKANHNTTGIAGRASAPAVIAPSNAAKLALAGDPDECFIDWQWLEEMVRVFPRAEERPRLYTPAMIARELRLSRHQLRNILNNWCECGPIIRVGPVRLYDSLTMDEVVGVLKYMGKY